MPQFNLDNYEWDLSKVKSFFKRGKAVKDIVDKSSFHGGWDVKVSRRQPND